MKKILITALAFCCFATSMKAIEYEPAPGFSKKIYVGMSIANLRNTSLSPKVGYSAGFMGEYMLPGCAGTYVNAAGELSMLGATDHGDRLRSHYLTVPLHIGFRYNINNLFGTYADFGPYFAFGMAGKWSESESKFFRRKNHGWDANRFDTGFGFRLGAEYNDRLSLTFGFNWGINKCIEIEEAKDIKTFNSSITLAYRF